MVLPLSLFDPLEFLSASTVGFSGTRTGMSAAQRAAFSDLLVRVGAQVLHHGDCVGADSDAHDAARELGLRVVGHPPVDPRLRAWRDCDELRDEFEYLVRNGHIVAESSLLVATPAEPVEQPTGGTWWTVRRARERQVGCVVIAPDGTLSTS